jgi:hypothetical protein
MVFRNPWELLRALGFRIFLIADAIDSVKVETASSPRRHRSNMIRVLTLMLVSYGLSNGFLIQSGAQSIPTAGDLKSRAQSLLARGQIAEADLVRKRPVFPGGLGRGAVKTMSSWRAAGFVRVGALRKSDGLSS